MTVSVGIFYNKATTVMTTIVKADSVGGLDRHVPTINEGISLMERATYDTMRSRTDIAAYLGLRAK